MTVSINLPAGPFTSKSVSAAVGIKATTISTWGERGAFATFDFPDAGKGRTRYFSRLDTLSLALLGQCNRAGLSLPELPEPQLRDWASEWVRGLGHERRVTHLCVRYYEVPSSQDSRTRITPNDDLLDEKPDHGRPALAITFDLDAIFLPVLTALSEAE